MRSHVLSSPLAALAVAVTASAGPPDPELQGLRAEVAQLRSEVRELRAATGENWLSERRAAEIKGLVHDVLADADMRASLMQDGVTAGWDKNFFVGSADGNWKLRIRGQIQVRWALSNLDVAVGSMTQPTLYGFEVRRAKLKFDGHIVDPSWKYVLNLAVDHDDPTFQGDLDVEDAIIMKSFDNGLDIWAGQFKLPFLQEELISSSSQQVVDRSLINKAFGQDRAKGIMLVYATERWRLQGAYSDGFGSRNRNALFVPAATGDMQASNAFTFRVDWLGRGDWNQFKDFTSPRGSEMAYKIGAAIHWERDKYNDFTGPSGGPPVPGGFKTEFLTYTLDASVEGDGWNVFAYFVGRDTNSDDPATADLNQLGFVVQGGYYFTDVCEGFARFEWGDDDLPGTDDLSIITLGANYYIDGHRVKWTNDIGFALQSVTSTWAGGSTTRGTSWRVDDTGQDGQVVIRSQLQLLF